MPISHHVRARSQRLCELGCIAPSCPLGFRCPSLLPTQVETDDPDEEYGIRSAWKVVDRVIAERAPPPNKVVKDKGEAKADEDMSVDVNSGTQLLVKWRGVQYDGCTWESSADLGKWGAEAEIAHFHSLKPIAASAEARKVRSAHLVLLCVSARDS